MAVKAVSCAASLRSEGTVALWAWVARWRLVGDGGSWCWGLDLGLLLWTLLGLCKVIPENVRSDTGHALVGVGWAVRAWNEMVWRVARSGGLLAEELVGRCTIAGMELDHMRGGNGAVAEDEFAPRTCYMF